MLFCFLVHPFFDIPHLGPFAHSAMAGASGILNSDYIDKVGSRLLASASKLYLYYKQEALTVVFVKEIGRAHV